MLKIYCTITGENHSLLKKETPASKKKVAILATCLMIPVLMWFVTGFLIAYQIMECSILISCLVAAVIAILIFLVERTIIMANSNKWMNIFRVCLGLCVAFLGSIFLDEVIFKSDIDKQLKTEREEEIKRQLGEIEESYKDKVAMLDSLVSSRYKDWQIALKEAKMEADGSGGSGERGISGITKFKAEVAQKAETEYHKASQDLKIFHEKINRESDLKKNEVRPDDSKGTLLIKIQALFNLVCNNVWMLIIYTVLTLFLFFLEFIVVIVKSNLPETSYERKVRLIEEISIRRMNFISQNNFYEPLHPSAGQVQKKLKDNIPSIF